MQGIRHDTSGGGSSSRAHGNVVGLCVVNEIPYNQEVLHVPHGLDYVQFTLQTDSVAVVLLHGRIAVPLPQPFITELPQVPIVGQTLRRNKFRQVIFPKSKFHLASVRDLLGDFQVFRVSREKLLHFLFGLQIEFVVLEFHPVRVVHLRTGLNTHQHILRLRIFFSYIVGIVGGRQRNIQILRKAFQSGNHRPVLRQKMVLNLQKEIALSKNLLQFHGFPPRPIVIVSHQHPLHISRQTAGKADDSFAVLPEHVFVHPWFEIETIHIPCGYYFYQIPVPLLILCQ